MAGAGTGSTQRGFTTLPPGLLPECALTLVSQPENEVSVTHSISHSSVTLIKKAHVVGSDSAGSESNIGSIPPEADGKAPSRLKRMGNRKTK